MSNEISLLIWQHVRIRVLFFGVLHDIVGLREDSLDVPEEPVWGRFRTLCRPFSALPGDVGQRRAGAESAIFAAFGGVSEGDEVAFLPPVSGGSGGFTQQIDDSGRPFFRDHAGSH